MNFIEIVAFRQSLEAFMAKVNAKLQSLKGVDDLVERLADREL